MYSFPLTHLKACFLLNLDHELGRAGGKPSGKNYYDLFRKFHRFLAVGLDIEASLDPDLPRPLHETISWYNRLLFRPIQVSSDDNIPSAFLQNRDIGDGLEALLRNMAGANLRDSAQVS